MRVCSLSSVQNRIALGQPLSFSVRDAEHQVLLAPGQVIRDEAQLRDLMALGALVPIDELREAFHRERREAPSWQPARLPAAWEHLTLAIRQALCAPAAEMAQALDGATDELLSLIDQSLELALSQVVHQSSSGAGHYGVNHAIHTATACLAAARQLGWQAREQRCAVQAALTMNLSILDLQARLANQVSPLTAKQREAIQEHPLRSAEMLIEAGITDGDWLDAVRQHHETPSGSGYPNQLTAVGEIAELLRCADVYTARLSRRANRAAMSAQQAGRGLHQIANASPRAAAVIKAFGIFPPGSRVRLASGELGVVVRHGEKVHHPRVVALTNGAGEPHPEPVLRDSARQEHAVVALLSPDTIPVRLTDAKLAELIVGA